MRFRHSFLKSLQQNDHMNWSIVSTELIDNALDAAATDIALAWGTHSFAVHDNGVGVSREGFEALYTLGGHRTPAANGRTIGRYGVGFKEAAAWLWGTTTIRSRHPDTGPFVQQLRINWEHEATHGDSDDAEALPLRTLKRASQPGTLIQCESIRQRPPSKELFDRLISQLAHIYRPALEAGAHITLQRLQEDAVTLAAAPWPQAASDTPRVEGILTVAGRSVHVVAYVTAVDQEYPGVHVASHGRVMDRITSKQNARRIYGWLALGDEWDIAKNKTEITDPHRDELWAAVANLCKPVFDAAEQEARRVRLQALLQTALYQLRNALVAEQLAPGAGRGPRPICTVKPVRTPREAGEHKDHTPPHQNPDNPQQKDSTAPYVNVQFAPVPTGELTVLEVTPTVWTVIIDHDHPLVTAYIGEPCFGARGEDPSRLVHVVISTVAGAAVTNDVVLAALPRLEGVPLGERYGTAYRLLWDAVLTAGKDDTTTSASEAA